MKKSVRLATLLILGFTGFWIFHTPQTYAQMTVSPPPSKANPFELRPELECEPNCAALYNKYLQGGYREFIVKLKAPFTREADLPDADAIAHQRKLITAVQDQFATQYLISRRRIFIVWPYELTPYLVIFGGIEELIVLMENPLVVGIFEDEPTSAYFDLGLLSLKIDTTNVSTSPAPIQCKPSCAELLDKASKQPIGIDVKIWTEKPIQQFTDINYASDPAYQRQQTMVRLAQARLITSLQFFRNSIQIIVPIDTPVIALGADKEVLKYLLSSPLVQAIFEEMPLGAN
jgi:hypothetical protein